MAMLFMDSMDLYGADPVTGDSDLTEAGWILSDASKIEVQATGRFGGHAVRVDPGENISRSPLITNNKCIVQTAVKLDTPELGDGEILRVTNAGGFDLCFAIRIVNGAIRLQDTNDATVLTTAPFARKDVWHYLEVEALIGDSSPVTIRFDGRVVVEGALVDTTQLNPDFDTVRFCGGFAGASWDDPIIMDGNGPQLNALLGDRRITVLLPDADTADDDWMKSEIDGGFVLIDDRVPGDHDGDGTFIEKLITPGLSMFGAEDLERAPVIDCVGTAAAMRRTDAGVATPQTRIRKGDSFTDASVATLTTSYQTLRNFFELDPDGDRWLFATVNGLEVGVRDPTPPNNMVAGANNMVAGAKNMVAG